MVHLGHVVVVGGCEDADEHVVVIEISAGTAVGPVARRA
jgi:hypothetical protein